MPLIPDVPGPKLGPFKRDSRPLTIDFLDILGDGLDGQVWKVHINNQLYALKIFLHGHLEVDPDIRNDPFYKAEQDYIQWRSSSPDYVYLDPFLAECRAYGRLQELEVTYVSAECYGYITLSPKHEEQLRCKGVKIGSRDRGDTKWPIYAIVKQFIDTEISFTPRMVLRMIRDLYTMHEVGICVGDIREENYLNGVLIDFGRSRTVPHPLLTPEYVDRRLAGHNLTDDLPKDDEESFDEMIDKYNRYTRGELIWRRINPNWDRKEELRKVLYRNYYHQFYSRFRPELFDWEAAVAARKRGEKLELKSRASNSRLPLKECDARKAKYLKVLGTTVDPQ